MKGLVTLGACLFGVSAKGIKQQMVENRLKFDRDVIAHGEDFDEDDWDYDDWDPFLDLDEDELEVRKKFKTKNEIYSFKYLGSVTKTSYPHGQQLRWICRQGRTNK